MLQKTPLYHWHSEAGAQLVDFAGWKMPLHYGSQIAEHHCVRHEVGMFDVSHMGLVDVTGEDATYFLRYILANDVQKLKSPGCALYSCLLNEQGGVIDDLIVYRLAELKYQLVLNAATYKKDLAWIQKQSERFEVRITERPDLGIIAVQGPKAIVVASQIFDEKTMAQIKALRPFQFMMQEDVLIARTGYTGEDGLELVVPEKKSVHLWKRFVEKGARPCGLGARDTLRLEAGLNLYGSDMDETTSPLVSNLAWTVSWTDPERDFIGRKVLKEDIDAGAKHRLVGLVMEEPGVLRNHQKVFVDEDGVGEITSGGFSPTLGHAIALARVPVNAATTGKIERRGKHIPVTFVKPPFVRHGKKVYIQEKNNV